ncbi:DUF4260 domain-containing protein [Sphingobacterium sp. Mn56C]|uniref:DUF4260 domain-containing protein n=1 Tax=Sphingobacterium sp. Mn56C TaxID=3395261 RepID=UPI003BCF6477
MRKVLKLEELGQFLCAIFLFSRLDYSWWLFPACILLPDLSMIGYAINTKVGAIAYNIAHHKALAILIATVGMLLHVPVFILVGIILYAHASMDRVFGYGLKYYRGFKYTHLGEIKKIDR